MKILVLTPEFTATGGGIATFYRALVPALVEAGVSVRIVEGNAFFSSRDARPRDYMGVTVETLCSDALERSFRRFDRYCATPEARRHLSAAWALWDQARTGDGFDIVEASDWGLLFAPPILDANVPVVAQLHGSIGQIAAFDSVPGQETGDSLLRLIEREIIRRAPRVQTSSRANAAFWKTQTEREVSVIRPAWRAPGPFSESGSSGRGLVVGRVQHWKGPDVVCEALRRLGAAAPALDWIGRDMTSGPGKRSMAARLKEAYPDVWDRTIKWRPPLAPDAVAHARSRALFNLAPSRWDVFNFAAVEAMASGRPVICSRGAGASELIQDGANGYLFDSGDADGLAAAIERVLAAPPTELARIGRAALKTVEAVLAPKAIAARRIDCYRDVIAGFKPRREEDRDWLDAACRPDGGRRHDEFAFLDHLPLKSLLRYAGRRTLRKVLRHG